MPRNAARPPSRPGLLDAALRVFTRYGYRKASMEEVARAARLSRQGLYLHYPTKEALFQAALVHALGTALAQATRALEDEATPLEARLVAACDAWCGPYVGLSEGDAADLMKAGLSLGADVIAAHEARFETALGRALRPAGGRAHSSEKAVARALYAAATGLKHLCATRADFVVELARVARVFGGLAQADSPRRSTR